MIIHTHLCLDAVMALPEEEFNETFDEGVVFSNGKPLSAPEVRELFASILAKGIKIMPMDECDNFDLSQGCLGHNYHSV